MSVSLVPGTSELPRQSRSKHNRETPRSVMPTWAKLHSVLGGMLRLCKSWALDWERPFNVKNRLWSKKRRANDKDICRAHPGCLGQPRGAPVLPCVLSLCQASFALSSFSSSVSSLSPAISGWNKEDQQSHTKRSLLCRAAQSQELGLLRTSEEKNRASAATHPSRREEPAPCRATLVR